jgi:hypothetical protein
MSKSSDFILDGKRNLSVPNERVQLSGGLFIKSAPGEHQVSAVRLIIQQKASHISLFLLGSDVSNYALLMQWNFYLLRVISWPESCVHSFIQATVELNESAEC